MSPMRASRASPGLAPAAWVIRAGLLNLSPRFGYDVVRTWRSSPGSEALVHNVKADAAERRVLKRLRNGPDDLKSERLPKSHSGVVCFHNGIELHCGVPRLTGPGERVLTERASDSAAPRIDGDHETRGGDVRAWSGTIRSHLRCPEHPRSVAGDNRVARQSLNPDGPGLLGRPSTIVSERITGGDDLPEDWPYGRPVAVDVLMNPDRGIVIKILS